MSLQQHAALEEPGPAYVKTVLISNMHCRRQKSQVANASCLDQMSKCGDYEDIDFYVNNVFCGIVIAVYFLPFKKKITLYTLFSSAAGRRRPTRTGYRTRGTATDHRALQRRLLLLTVTAAVYPTLGTTTYHRHQDGALGRPTGRARRPGRPRRRPTCRRTPRPPTRRCLRWDRPATRPSVEN